MPWSYYTLKISTFFIIYSFTYQSVRSITTLGVIPRALATPNLWFPATKVYLAPSFSGVYNIIGHSTSPCGLSITI